MAKRVWIVICILAVGLTFFLLQREQTVSLNWLQTLASDDIEQLEITRTQNRYREVPPEEYADFVAFLHGMDWSAAIPIQNPEVSGGAIQLRIALRDGTVHYVTNLANMALYIDGTYYKPNPEWLAEFNFEAEDTLPENFHW